MSDSDAADLFASLSPTTVAVIFYGDKFIELDQPSTDGVTLGDLCEAFAVAWESGVHLRQRHSRHVVATLPFEPIPPMTSAAVEVAEAIEGPAVFPSRDGAGNVDVDEAEEDEAQGGRRRTAVTVYDLRTPTLAAEEEVTLQGQTQGIKGEVMEEVMRHLVELGATELLSAASTAPLAMAREEVEYNPAGGPYMFQCMAYPPSVYSPYRRERDPIATATRTGSRLQYGHSAASQIIHDRDGRSYTSYTEAYDAGVAGAKQGATQLHSDYVPLTEEELHDIYHA